MCFGEYMSVFVHGLSAWCRCTQTLSAKPPQLGFAGYGSYVKIDIAGSRVWFISEAKQPLRSLFISEAKEPLRS